MEQKRKCQTKERSERAEAWAVRDEQEAKNKRRTQLDLFMAQFQQDRENHEK